MAGTGKAHLSQGETVLRIEDLVVEFPVGRSGLKVSAVAGISIDVREGETLGLVGESGCGKSTLGKAIMQIVSANSGQVMFGDVDLRTLRGEELRQTRPRLQMIFQDPISSLNPRRRVGKIVREGLDIWKIGDEASRRAKVLEVLEVVGIDAEAAIGRRPHEFSGGQCQRISIARAVATEPRVIICDEPVSALDVSVQAQILNLLEDMKARYGLTLVFIAHDLAVVKNISDRVAVMYLGKLCEIATPDDLYASPAHPYTAALLSAIPVADPEVNPTIRGGVGGEIPSPLAPPSGCRFRTRCPLATEKCTTEEPAIKEVRPNHFVACHFPLAAGQDLPALEANIAWGNEREVAAEQRSKLARNALIAALFVLTSFIGGYMIGQDRSTSVTKPTNLTNLVEFWRDRALTAESELDAIEEYLKASQPGISTKNTYVIAPNDSLWNLAASKLGDGMRWREIYELNRTSIGELDSNSGLPKSSIGITIVIPAK